MTSRGPLLPLASLLFCLCPAAQAVTPSAAAAPKASPAATQTGPIFSLGGISIAPGPQCFTGPTVNTGAAAKPQSTHPHHAAPRSRRVSEPVPLRTYARA